MSIIFSKTPLQEKLLVKKLEEGRVLQIYNSIYTDDTKTSLYKQIQENIMEILKGINLKGVLSGQDALLEAPNYLEINKITVDGVEDKTICLGGFDIIVRKTKDLSFVNCKRLSSDTPLLIPLLPRMILENAHLGQDNPFFTLLSKKIKSYFFENKNMDSLKHEIKNLAEQINNSQGSLALALVEKIHQDIFGQYGGELDLKRIKRFEQLQESLNNLIPYKQTSMSTNPNSLLLMESYFTNFIEGNEFSIEEVLQFFQEQQSQVVHKKTVNSSVNSFNYSGLMDMWKTYQLIVNNAQNPILFETYEQFKENILNWHYQLFSHRKNELSVGEFKKTNNRAGLTEFVDKDWVDNTFKKAFELYDKMVNPLIRGVFLKTIFVEIHPFEDGNGRISRLLLNNELSLHGYNRLILPTVFSEDYIGSLKAMRNEEFVPLVHMFNQLIKINQEIDFSQSITQVIKDLNKKNAFCYPHQTLWGKNKFSSKKMRQ